METSFVRVCDYDMSSRVHRVLPLHLDFERLESSRTQRVNNLYTGNLAMYLSGPEQPFRQTCLAQ